MNTRLLLCLFAFGTLLARAGQTQAAAPAAPYCDEPAIQQVVPPPPCPNCTGLDIVFVVDESGSMFGVPNPLAGERRLPPSDPEGLRFDSTRFAAEWLGSDRLYLHTDAIYRISIVDFGDGARVFYGKPFDSAGWYAIEPGSEADWQAQYQVLEGLLGPGRIPASLGETNALEALVFAKGQFDKLAQYPDIGPRRKVVIFLTDGVPYFEGATNFGALKNYATRNFPVGEYAFYAVGMRSPGEGDYWAEVENCWQDITGLRAQDVATNEDVGKVFQNILRELTADFPGLAGSTIETITQPGPVVFPPYLASAAFTFFKSKSTDTLALTDASGAPIECAGNPKVFCAGVDKPIQTIRVFDPSPGQWYVGTNPSLPTVSITLEKIPVTSRLTKPGGVQLQYLPTTIEYTLLDSRGQLLPRYPDPRYALKVQAEVHVSGKTYTLTLTENSNGTHSSEFTPVDLAPHEVFVTATSQDLLGNPVDVFSGTVGAFDVSPILLQPVTVPTSAQQYVPFDVTFGLFDTNGRALTLADCPDAEMSLIPPGKSSGSPVTLTCDAQGRLTGAIKSDEDGLHTLHLQAAITDAAGTTHELMDADVSKIDVAHTRLLSFAFVRPEQPLADIVREWWWFEKKPLVVGVQLLGEDGKPADPSQVLKGDPAQAFALTVVDSDLKDRSSELALAPTAATGAYQAQSEAFDTGVYTVTVKSALTPVAGYAFDRPEQALVVTRVMHPLHVALARYGPWAALAFGLMIAGVIVWDKRRRAHPAKGSLSILRTTDRAEEWPERKLDDYNLNHIVFKDFPDTTNIRQMDVYSKDNSMSQSGTVEVVITMTDGSPQRRVTLAPRGRETIGGYILIKDPTINDRFPEVKTTISKSRYQKNE